MLHHSLLPLFVYSGITYAAHSSYVYLFFCFTLSQVAQNKCSMHVVKGDQLDPKAEIHHASVLLIGYVSAAFFIF